jgi:hypothetical protein
VHAAEPARDAVAANRRPAGASRRPEHSDAQELPLPVRGDAGRDHRRRLDAAPARPALLGEGGPSSHPAGSGPAGSGPAGSGPASRVQGAAAAGRHGRGEAPRPLRARADPGDWDWDHDAIPNVCAKPSPRRLETPAREDSATTATSARSPRRRGWGSPSGQELPWRSFGIATSILPTRVSHGRGR